MWLTGRPVSKPNDRRVAFTDLSVDGVTDSAGTSLLIKLANAPGLSGVVADVLTQNFTRDYDELLGKIGRAIADERTGNLLIRAHIDQIQTGELKAAGQGLYLPVRGQGEASITLVR